MKSNENLYRNQWTQVKPENEQIVNNNDHELELASDNCEELIEVKTTNSYKCLKMRDSIANLHENQGGKVLFYLPTPDKKLKSFAPTFSPINLPAKIANVRNISKEMKMNEKQSILLFGGINPLNTELKDQGKKVLRYDFISNTWKILCNMPSSKHHHCAVFCCGNVYVLGGTKSHHTKCKTKLSKSMWSFTPNLLEWRIEKNIPNACRDFGLVATDRGFYIIGGEDSDRVLLSSVYYYNILEFNWFEKESLITGRSGLATALVKNEIWVAGGRIQDGDVTDLVESYNLGTGHWSQISVLRKSRSFARIAVSNKTDVYIIGGARIIMDKHFSSLSSIDKYNWNTNTWEKIENMVTARHGHDIVTLDDDIFILGGVSTITNSALVSIECLSTKAMTWVNKILSLPMALSGFAVILHQE